MIPTIKIDSREWQAAARALFETSSRTCVDFTNGQALKVAIESTRQTEKANRIKIAYELGVIGRAVEKRISTRGKNKGKTKFKLGKFEVKQDSFAERILGSRFQKTGEWGVRGDTMDERAHNLIVGRQRAASFIASGWIAARNALWSIVKNKPAGTKSLGGAKQYGRPKGWARPAIFSLKSNIQSVIANTALQSNVSKPPATGGDPMPVATRGLQQAINSAAQDMLNELARRLDPDFKKVSAR